MVLLDGIEYSVKTPEENTDDLITYINEYCQAHNIQNSLGETIYIEDNKANPLYMLAFGIGYLMTNLEKLIYSAGCSMSIAEASERQLLNLADIAGIRRSLATRTTIQGVIYADTVGPNARECVITQDLTATLIISGNEVVFHPAFDVTVPIGESRQIVLIAEEYGSYNISANTIQNFDDPVPGLRQLVTARSIAGHNEETIANLRARLQRRTVEGTQVERAAFAIQNLEGVAMCSIYFNYSPQQVAYVGSRNIAVQPRTALLMVQGYNPDIAETFYRYLFCATSGEDVDGAYTQYYITHANQQLPVHIIPPVQENIYARVFIKNNLSYEQVDGIIDTICALSGELTIGQAISSVEVIKAVQDTYPNLTIQGAELSLDNETWSYVQKPEYDAVFIFSTENIEVTSTL